MTHICVFTSGIDDLPKRRQRDKVAVARIIAKAGRFSVFEATATPALARTMDEIEQLGWFQHDPEKGGFPWVYTALTDAGRKALGEDV